MKYKNISNMTEKSSARHSLANNSTAAGTGITPEDIVPLLAQWSREEREELLEALQAILDEPDPDGGGSAAEPSERKQQSVTSSGSTAKKNSGWVELRIVNGCGPYAYQRWRENGRKRSKYIGKVKREDAA